ncbi:MAG: GNAT family N-acetyltransferase [Thermoanaerobaculia bacterium]
MKLRAADITDARAIAEVHVLSWQHAYRGLLPQGFLDGLSVEQRQAVWSSSLTQGEASVLVAEVKDRVVGFSAFAPCRDEGAQSSDYEVLAIYVDPSQWSTGVGRGLWLKSREVMVAQGAGRVSLWVLVGNERAIRFYTAAGFQPDPGSVKAIEVGGVQAHEARYVLRSIRMGGKE